MADKPEATVKNNIDYFINMKRANTFLENGKTITLADISKEFSDRYGVGENALILIKSGNYNPSILVALYLAEYFGTNISELFSLGEASNND